MTLDEFFEELKKAKPSFEWFIFHAVRARNSESEKTTPSYIFCPITALHFHKTKELRSAVYAWDIGQSMGLSYSDVKDIIYVVDDMKRSYGPDSDYGKIKNKILEVLA